VTLIVTNVQQVNYDFYD